MCNLIIVLFANLLLDSHVFAIPLFYSRAAASCRLKDYAVAFLLSGNRAVAKLVLDSHAVAVKKFAAQTVASRLFDAVLLNAIWNVNERFFQFRIKVLSLRFLQFQIKECRCAAFSQFQISGVNVQLFPVPVRSQANVLHGVAGFCGLHFFSIRTGHRGQAE